MKEMDKAKPPEQIEDEIKTTREEINQTLRAIEQKLSPNQLMNQAIRYVGGSGASSRPTTALTTRTIGDYPVSFNLKMTRLVMENFTDTIKNHPVPIALIMTGFAWLMVASNRGGAQTGSARTYAYTEAYDPYSSESDKSSALGDKIGAAKDAIGGTIGAAKAKMSEKISGLKEQAQGTVAGARERMSHSSGSMHSHAGGMRERIGGVTGTVRMRASSLASGVSQRSHNAQQYGARAYQQGQTMLEEYPLAVGAIGFALGALLGVGLPATRREDEWVGRTRDTLMEQAQKVGKEQFERVRYGATQELRSRVERVVEASVEASTQAVKEQATQSLKDKIGQVVDATSQATQKGPKGHKAGHGYKKEAKGRES